MSEEQEDFNAFNHWDCLGASLMLGITPAILNFTFNDKDVFSTALIGGIGVLFALVVWLFALITRWRMVGVLVNGIGTVLTVFYIAVAVYLWIPKGEEMQAEAEPAPLPAMPAEN